jgi:ABC-type sugar transport system substrate-binding protein
LIRSDGCHPGNAGICVFDSNSGPGIALAVKEAGKVGKIKIITVDWDPDTCFWSGMA